MVSDFVVMVIDCEREFFRLRASKTFVQKSSRFGIGANEFKAVYQMLVKTQFKPVALCNISFHCVLNILKGGLHDV